MASSALLAALKRRRELSVKLDGGKEVLFLRPPESAMGTMLQVDGEQRRWVVGIEHVLKYVTGWKGFTEADLLGASIGSSDPADFSTELWEEFVSDDVALISKVADAILASVVEHVTGKAEALGNSPPA